MRITWILLIVFYIQIFTISLSDGKSKVKSTLKSSSKPKSTSSKIASTVGKVASTLAKPKVGKGFGGLKVHKAIPIGAAVAGGAILLPFLMRKKFKRRKLIPAFIGRDRYYNRYGMQCYSCEGMGADGCVTNPMAYARRVTCGPGQYCSVLRREIAISDSSSGGAMQSDEPDLVDELETVIDEEVSALNETLIVETNETAIVISVNSTIDTLLPHSNQVFISRGCNSPESMLHTTTQLGDGEKFTAKLYSQFCLADFCNTGDGHLKCYECEGEGFNHPCMISPALISKKVTCQANQYCNVLRLTTMAYFPDNDTTVTKVTIVRGCREDEEYEEQDGISLQSLSCSSDYCNGVDGNHLTDISAASGLNPNKATGENLVLIVLCVFILFRNLSGRCI